ncbi:MAG: efflux RND transporter periplasmic adaptor subunit [Acidobacteria bacterium]|nr:efflux RND transporter periplasmic adaptor subunit [Acidobacteriota bacterium]
MKKLIAGLVLLAAAGGGAYYYYTYGKTEEKPQVVQATITQGTIIEQVQATGTLEAWRTVQVGPQVSGTIQWLGADFNSIVRAGETIARLDPSLLQTQVDIQTANIERQETEIASQRVQLEDAQRNLARTKELFEKGLANQTQLEQAELTVKTRQAQIASADKQLVQARANLSQAKLNVSYTEVKAPIDGVVVNRRVDIGQTVQSSMNITPFFDIATDLRALRLSAQVDEADIGKVQPGMPVAFTVDSYAGQTFQGTVSAVRLNAFTQNNVVTYPVWIDAPNPDLKLRPSMTATVRIRIAAAENVVRVPNQALRFRPTNDIYTALGLTPPPPTAGGRGRGGREGGAVNGAPETNASPAQGGQRQQMAANRAGTRGQAAAGDPQAQGREQRQAPAQGGEGRANSAGGRGGFGAGEGQGFGRGQFANLSPEERQRLREQFGGGRGGNGQGGRGGANAGGFQGRRGGNAQNVAAAAPQGRSLSRSGADLPPLEGASKIDELFQPTPQRITPGSVWTWDEAGKKLTEIRVTTALTDGQFSQLVSGDLKPGQQVVTNVIVPISQAQRNQQNNIFGNQGRGGFGGMQPGFGPGGMPGGGTPGGGGGGNRGGGGRGGD